MGGEGKFGMIRGLAGRERKGKEGVGREDSSDGAWTATAKREKKSYYDEVSFNQFQVQVTFNPVARELEVMGTPLYF